MSEAPSRQRVDSWLWMARFFRTRASAQAALAAGQVRRSGRLLDKGDMLRAGDVLTLVAGDRLRTVEVAAFAEKRGGAAAGQALYRDLHPPA